MYQIRILKPASKELAKIDNLSAQRIASRIRWLAANLDDFQLESLGGDLSSFYKLRVGDYRILYQILHDERMVIIH